MKQILIFLAPLIVALYSCSGKGISATDAVEGDTLTTASRFLTVIDCGDYMVAQVFAPWSDSVPIGRYAIVKDEKMRDKVPDGYEVIVAPLKRSVVFSAVHTSAINDLGMLSAVKGVADGAYYLPDDTVTSLLKDGKMADVGSSISPSVEKLIDLEPDALLMSPYAGNDASNVNRMDVPVIYMADYLEPTPRARTEWIILLGELYGCREHALEMYEHTMNSYNYVKDIASRSEIKPKVIVDKPMSGTWYVPGGDSYLAKMIEDAGAYYPWSDNSSEGSIALDVAAVLDRGADADIWLIRDVKDYNERDLSAELPRAESFRAFPSATYMCNTVMTPYYNLIAFHPDEVLAEFAAIFHPELFQDYPFSLYKKLEK